VSKYGEFHQWMVSRRWAATADMEALDRYLGLANTTDEPVTFEEMVLRASESFESAQENCAAQDRRLAGKSYKEKRMNRIDACNLIAAGITEGRINLRLSAFVAAMRQSQIAYEQVGLSEWWSARCQLAMILTQHGMGADVGFKAKVPCGKQELPKLADADDFCDPRYRPTKEDVVEALRKLDLLKRVESLTADEQLTLDIARR
jgi:hypothetical protein